MKRKEFLASIIPLAGVLGFGIKSNGQEEIINPHYGIGCLSPRNTFMFTLCNEEGTEGILVKYCRKGEGPKQFPGMDTSRYKNASDYHAMWRDRFAKDLSDEFGKEVRAMSREQKDAFTAEKYMELTEFAKKRIPAFLRTALKLKWAQ